MHSKIGLYKIAILVYLVQSIWSQTKSICPKYDNMNKLPDMRKGACQQAGLAEDFLKMLKIFGWNWGYYYKNNQITSVLAGNIWLLNKM